MTTSEKIAIIYHEIFNYALSKDELSRWKAGPKLKLTGLSSQRKKFETSSSTTIDSLNEKKLKIAAHAGDLLSRLPTIQFIGITGSLAMHNAKAYSDIDLMIITKRNALWISRFISLLLLSLCGYKIRRANVREEADKLCLNYWIDEDALFWGNQQNAYIAHEIAQVVPLINKNHTYEKWLEINAWIQTYWPNATMLKKYKKRSPPVLGGTFLMRLLNFVFFAAQKFYMQRKITRETVELHKALFHPYDWGEKVMKMLRKKGIVEV